MRSSSPSPLFKSHTVQPGSRSPPPIKLRSITNSPVQTNHYNNVLYATDLSGNTCANIQLDTKQQQDIYLNNNDSNTTIDGASISYTLDQLKSICHRCVPGWYRFNYDRLDISPLHGGTTNLLYVVWLKDDYESNNNITNNNNNTSLPSGPDSPRIYDRVVVRVFGNDTNVFFNRTFEQYVTKKLLVTSQGLYTRYCNYIS